MITTTATNMSNKLEPTQNAVFHINKIRKRPIHPEQWKKTVAKTRKNKGEHYVSARGSAVPGKVLPAPGKQCKGRCKFGACTLTQDTVKIVFQNYWGMGTYQQQRNHLLGLLSRVPTPRRTYMRYYIPVNGQKAEVCSTTFLHVYQIGRRVVRNLVTVLEKGDMNVVDKRGSHLNRPYRLEENIKERILEHIHSFPKLDVHYSRNKNGETYLSSDLNLAKMFRDFCVHNGDIDQVLKKEWLYIKTFRETKLMIGKPHTDTCKQCDLLQIKLKSCDNDNTRQEVMNLIESHQTSSDNGYEAMREDVQRSKVDPSYTVKCCDLQQVLFSPTLTHSEMFYKRKFSSYNFCIYDGQSDEGTMAFWTEVEGNRGVDEIASCILHDITTKYQPLLEGEQRTLVLWSDRCRGQNNNWQMLCLCLYLIKRKLFTCVTQKFLVSGHSFMHCDRLFAMIEKQKKTSMAYVPEDYIRIIQSAQPSRPFPILRMNQDYFMDIKSLEIHFPRPAKLKVSEIAVCEVTSANPSVLLTREDHNPSVWTMHRITAPNQARIPHARRAYLDLFAGDIQLRRKYHGPLPLSVEKQNDLKSMLPYLMEEHRQFYMNCIAESEDTQNMEREED